MTTEAAVLDALMAVKDPDLHQDIVTLGFIKKLRIDGDRVAFAIELTTPACPVKEQMREQAHAAVSALPGVKTVDVETKAETVSFKERTDVTAVPAAGVVAETMVSLVLASESLRKFGGDSLAEFVRNHDAYRASLR